MESLWIWSLQRSDLIKVNEQPDLTVVETGPACRRPLGVSVEEQMCWSTVATTGCVHCCGISTVSARVGQGWEMSEDAAQTDPSCLVHENAPTRMHFWVVNVHTGAHKYKK